MHALAPVARDADETSAERLEPLLHRAADGSIAKDQHSGAFQISATALPLPGRLALRQHVLRQMAAHRQRGHHDPFGDGCVVYT